MAAELHALIYGFDNAYMVQDIVSETLGRKIEIDAYVDSRTVFNVVAKNSATLEKRLQIDVNALRQSHSNGELRYLAWIPGFQNLADGLTKGLVGKTHPLWKALTTNRVSITPEGWVNSKGNPSMWNLSKHLEWKLLFQYAYASICVYDYQQLGVAFMEFFRMLCNRNSDVDYCRNRLQGLTQEPLWRII